MLHQSQEPCKSFEELQEEFDRRFELLIVKTKRNFYVSQETAEYRYNQFCQRQDQDFKFANLNGFFPPKITIATIGSGLALQSGSSGPNWDFSSMVPSYNIGHGKAGYYKSTDNNGAYIKIHLARRPIWPLRKLVKAMFDFDWVEND